ISVRRVSRIVLSDHAGRHTLAGGRELDPLPPRRGRLRPERLASLAALAEPDAGGALGKLVDAAGIVDLPRFALVRNMPQSDVEALADMPGFHRLGSGTTAIAIGAARLGPLGDSLPAALGQWHAPQADP